MLTKCQGEVPSTLYNTITQWSYYAARKWLRGVKYFAQGSKLLSNRASIQIHAWFLEAMLRTSLYLSYSLTDLPASSSVPLRGETRTLPGCLLSPFVFSSTGQPVGGRCKDTNSCLYGSTKHLLDKVQSIWHEIYPSILVFLKHQQHSMLCCRHFISHGLPAL